MSDLFFTQSGRHLKTFAYEQIALTGGAVGFTDATWGSGTATPAVLAIVKTSGDGVRHTEDGATTPTTSLGMHEESGDVWFVSGTEDIEDCLIIGDSASAVIDVQYCR